MDADVPPGLIYVEDFLSSDEEAALLAVVDGIALGEVRMHGVVARRRVAHFGLGYAYAARALEPAPPPPIEIDALRTRAAALVSVEPAELAEILVSRYPPGAGIGWHRDAPQFGVVVGISLGGPARFRMRRTLARSDGGAVVKFEQQIAPRSVYVLAGQARWTWQHMIPPVKSARTSVTFRTLRRK
jgi:alkylated DNA repair protein (DNA oxidative demethylase)